MQTAAATATKPSAYRVELLYKTKRHRVLLGTTEHADDEGRAYMQAVQRHIKPFKARTLINVAIAKAEG